MSADLDQAVYALLTPLRLVTDLHKREDDNRCRHCGMPWPCFDLGTAIEALDLVLRVHIAARSSPDDSAVHVRWNRARQTVDDPWPGSAFADFDTSPGSIIENLD